MENISIRQIRAFLAVASTRNFSQAADSLNVSASALSLTIQQFEQRIGLSLFDRTTRTVALTPAGAAFLPVAGRIIADFAKAIDDLVAFPTQQRGRVIVGAAASVISTILSGAIADLYKLSAGINVHLIEDTTESLANRVIHGELDFGITTLWTKIHPLVTVPFLNDRLGILASLKHSLGQEASPVQWKELGCHNMVALRAGAGIRAQIELDPRLADLLKQPHHEVSSVSALAALVQTGLGVAVIPALTASTLDSQSFVFRPLVKPTSSRNLFFIRARDKQLTTSAKLLLRAVIQRLEALHGLRHIRTNMTFGVDVDLGSST